MIDLHTHLLPGVDDGSPSIDASRPVLERFAAEGVTTVVCTPHLAASEAGKAGPGRERHAAMLAELAAAVPGGPQLLLGWEIMLDEPGVDLAPRELALGTSTAVLVEFPRTSPPGNGAAELFRIRMSGIVPVLAHPERYWGCTVDAVREWRRCGAVIQMDAIMLFGKSPMSVVARDLVTHGLVDCMASDNHADKRSLRAAHQWVAELAGEEQAALLTRENPRRILADEPTLPAVPLTRRRGMGDRLRELGRSLAGGRRQSR
ncbi:MAG TPA: CpsB/CapC family capsule biosynthesis tyrosine phosphatase [Gemmatimonadaceae bacterium]|nr:CpsB/CapC family capsule biosynthesis tyrosine phosphatase [Gemmatimonadaceae bacterium]